MDQLTTYTVKSKQSGYIWLFKYGLNGNFISFQIMDGELSNKQIQWLFASENFPATETIMKSIWMGKTLQSNFEIIKAEPILDFVNLWNLYDNKVAKFDAEKSFNKLKDADKIKCFLAIPGYKKYLAKKAVGIAHLATFINKRYFEDDWSKG